MDTLNVQTSLTSYIIQSQDSHGRLVFLFCLF